jgi:hypothetical protein
VLHWGRSGGWRRAVQPGLPAGSDLSSVLVRSGRVIAGGSAPNGRTGRTPFLVSWNGSAWSGPLGPGASPTNWQVGDVAPDGHGGTWVLGIRGDTGPGPNPARLWHVVAGRWYPVQPKFGKHVWWLLLQITAVPHTDSVWGAGYLLTGRTAAGLMALAGPAPR